MSMVSGITYHTDLMLDLGDMFISGCGVEDDTCRCQFVFHGSEFTIHEHLLDSKATCAVGSLHVLGRLHELLDLAINDVLGGSELDISCEAQSCVLSQSRVCCLFPSTCEAQSLYA